MRFDLGTVDFGERSLPFGLLVFKAMSKGDKDSLSQLMRLRYFSGLIRVREMSENFNFFQGQGIVREFHIVSGKNEILSDCQGILHFSHEVKERTRFSFSKYKCNDFKYKRQSIFCHFVSPHLPD